MKLLNDQQIHDAIASGALIIEGLQIPANAFEKGSPIQAASIDLTIGEIYSPTLKADGRYAAKTGYILKPGHTVHVLTKETLRLPSTIAGWGFPPTTLSREAILMTNPGHVDPGYCGKLGFTLINMGKVEFHLIRGAVVCSLLLCEISTPTADYRSRYGAPRERDMSQIMEPLSSDFMSFETTATTIAERAIKVAQIKATIWPAVVTAFVTLAIAGAGFALQYVGTAKKDDLRVLNEKILVLEQREQNADLADRLNQLEDRLVNVEARR